ncbi:MAG TPA: sugar ABC transporter substrate-binding protein [Firmicutes bacterium]|nr:sugar ABC transporter substrate-binding protein [Bacillota bacterium]
MKRMSRMPVLPAILLVLLLMALFSFPGMAAEKTKLVWGLYTNIPERVTVWEGWAKKFEALHPNVEVEILGAASGWYDKLLVWIAGGVAPDVAWMGMNMYVSFTDLLLPLNHLIDKDPAIKSILPQAHINMTWEGQILGLTYGLNTHTVFYNKDMFNEAGLAYPKDDWTWDDAMNMAKQFTKDTNGDGVPDRWGLNVYWPYTAWNYGGDVFSPDGRTILINRPATIKTMQLFADLNNGKAGVQPPASLNLGDSKAQVANGITAMAPRGVFDITYFQNSSKFDWDVVGMPATVVDGQRYRATFFSPEAWCIPRDAKNPDLAAEFIRFILQPEQTAEFAAIGAIIPSQPQVAADVFYKIDPSKNLMAFLRALDYTAQQYWAHPAYNQLGLTSGQYFTDMLNGAMAAQFAIPEIARQANEILKQFYAGK